VNETSLAVPPPSPRSDFEREKQSFFRLLPDLRKTHLGQYVAVQGEQVVDFGPNQAEVALRVLRRLDSVPIFVHLVSEEMDPIYRSGVVRVGPGAAS
jgi:hypothetical protein